LYVALFYLPCVGLIIENTKSEITAFLFDDMLLLTLTKGAKKSNRLRVSYIVLLLQSLLLFAISNQPDLGTTLFILAVVIAADHGGGSSGDGGSVVTASFVIAFSCCLLLGFLFHC
jgi:cell division protein FtsW (lipid II flippase)